ncbi:ATP-binding cassette domain-containing protein [Allosaccharopolyspora coralli]|uniref:ATP-binding cassette domain-containing protein n=1 Tax=Allosaccharopolyspora coralli TaxID=2665642 RepID=A0A5Q3QHU2_9PSEU|nr:ABC transporter ATP-binding protein [Allosaccharopolyspora coralli]QGK70407.1 ATP-binding cassette domain-containing protein [Allosaccharopolyspora coralli]
MRLTSGARLLHEHLRPHRRSLGLLLAWSAIEALPTFASGILVARAIDSGFLAGRPGEGFGWLATLAALWVVSAFGTRQVYPRLADTVEPMRDTLLRAVVAASLHRVVREDRLAGGSSVAQITEQVDAVRMLLSTMLRNMRQIVAAGVAALGGLVVLSPFIAAVTAVCVTVAVAFFALLLRVLLTRYRNVVLHGEQVGERAVPVVDGIRDVVTQTAESRAAADVGEAVERQAASLRAFARARVFRLPVVTLGVHVPLIALLALSPWLLSTQSLSTGALAGGVVYLAGPLQSAMLFLVNAGSTMLVSIGVVLDRLAEVCSNDRPSDVEHGAVADTDGYDIRLNEVTFGYSHHSHPVLDRLDLDLPADSHLAVVGPSGIGKSTLANVLARLVEPAAGTAFFGGTNLDRLGADDLRRELALIPQDAYVFAGTVWENLTYLAPDATRSEVDLSVDATGARTTVDRLGGYAATIPPGGDGLSPGERQLIALARVHVSRARVVVLDEATCHLDPGAEARAERAFSRRPGTLVVIAHRISSAQRADRILVLSGTGADVGGHDELLSRNRLYADLVGHWQAVP